MDFVDLERQIWSQNSTYSLGAVHGGWLKLTKCLGLCCCRVVLLLAQGDVATRVDLRAPDMGPAAARWLQALLRAGVLHSSL